MKHNEMPKRLMTKNETTDYGRISDNPHPQDESQKELFTGGEWTFDFAKWAKEAPTMGFHIRSGEASICGLNVNTTSHILPKDHDWYRSDIHITPEEAEANCLLLYAAPDMYRALKEMVGNFWGNYEEKYRESFRKDFPDHIIIKAEEALKKANPHK